MAKRASAGELRTLVYFRRVSKAPGGNGYPMQEETCVFTDSEGREQGVHCKWVNAHGAEVFSAMQLQIRKPATLTMRYSPKVDASMLIYKGRDPRPYEIISIDNVEERGQWLELKVQRKGAAR